MPDPLDYSHLSSLLRRLHDKWWMEMLHKDWKNAAYTANDIEACGRGIASITHRIYEETLNGNPASEAGPDRSAPDSSERGA